LFDLNPSLVSVILKEKPDVVFNGVYGTFGEDGALPLILDAMHVPYTHSGYAASKMGINKHRVLLMAKSLGIPVSQSVLLTKKMLLDGAYHVTKKSILKPCSMGSSFCTFILEAGGTIKDDELESVSTCEDNFFLLEDFFVGTSVDVGIIGGKAIGAVEIAPNDAFCSYKAKYSSGGSEYYIPARIEAEIATKIMKSAEDVHQALGCGSISRSDFIVNKETGEYRFLEINTHPGMTPTSLLPKLAANVGVTYNDIIKLLLDEASYQEI
jgi:D-alanine-D-alanine ligase